MTPSDRSPAVRCRGVLRTYHLDGSEVSALRGVDLDLAPGTFTALVGPSGSGKSTLLRLLACVDRPDRGSIQIDGVEAASLSRRGRLRLRRRTLGFMFQAPADNLLDYLTVRQHLRLAAQLRGLPADIDLEEDTLERLGLAGRAEHLPRQLSGGEQQRVGIAFAAFGPPALLLADEPTGQLDHGAVDGVLDAFLAMAAAGVAVVAATHDPAVAGRAHQVVRMRDGIIEEHS
ncbi:ABC transporter ATP-binding protein [Rugosimonospora africana]|uniref:Peptide ABC transporter ATP-binding protein n=1 Tax=Rugosimonospora africana TaxID=556532 RepID=A0A8J3QNG6_9ACTN|nr:ATP-binding cassette domain-containing protein [Rugosimonospora africana]GIH12875.1 peptide ABC transporter ATP-binding protein [Rugosimonospora africana]